MLVEHSHDFQRHGGDVGTGFHGLDDVKRVSDRRHEDFAIVSVSVDHVHRTADRFHSIAGDVIDAADEVGNIGRPDLGGEQGLGDGKDQCAVRSDSPVREGFNERNAGLDERDLDDDLGMPRGDLEGFLEHGVVIGGDNLGADVAVGDELTNFENGFLEPLPAFGNESRVRRYAIDDPPIGGLLYFFYVSGIHE